MARRGYTQHQLVSCLDAQERKVEQPVEAVNELLTEFDPLYNPSGDPELERFLRFGHSFKTMIGLSILLNRVAEQFASDFYEIWKALLLLKS